MNIKRIDLHVHSNASDGTLSPTELVALAVQKHMQAFALTDHDTTAGIEEAMVAGEEYGIELIPGIELSTSYHGRDIHIVGLGIDPKNVYFQDFLIQFQESRHRRNRKMIEKLREYHIDITYEKMLEAFGDSIWTRAHFGRFLQENGYVRNMWDAFPKYIGDDAPCFVPREKVTPFQGIELIHQGGGYAILAHPLTYQLSNDKLDTLVKDLAEAGLDGMEVMYSTHIHGDESNMRMLAKKYNLKCSGGSDFHGANKPSIQLATGKGNLNMTYDVWEQIQA